jgi:hypothetical protein
MARSRCREKVLELPVGMSSRSSEGSRGFGDELMKGGLRGDHFSPLTNHFSPLTAGG